MFPALNPKISDAIECACVRPVFLAERTADRGVRPDLWQALVSQVDVEERARLQSARGIELGLVIGVECEGLEEPSQGSRMPKHQARKYTLRERVVLMEQGSMRRQVQDQDDVGEGGQVEETTLAVGERNLDPVVRTLSPLPPAPARTTDDPPALPSSLLGSLTSNRDRRGLRYVDGNLQLGTVGSTTAFASTVLANQLIPPRDISPQMLASYTQKIQPYFLSTSSLAYRLFSFALERGPAQPFTHLDAVSAMPHQVHKSVMYTALKKAVIRPVFVAHELGQRHGNEQVWDHLTARMGGFVPANARLVVVLGLEIVGLEDPRAGGRVPKPAERVYVVRERYALVV
ncbi:hypothetical protein BCR44DRAFT_1098978 [Catenaria anguillulae PL171]|uniref:Uncharacterized protein n=1 Tax=Catenaria anguillulae PL171 TaxID=765915 RepID=A0A1Y2I1F2_9FUNG|nr:hypothetical protein BCR44DRAFT_1098978 [Catenaria anguillulae PL171]